MAKPEYEVAQITNHFRGTKGTVDICVIKAGMSKEDIAKAVKEGLARVRRNRTA